VEGEDAKEHWTVQKFMRLAEEQRRKLTVGAGLLSEKQYMDAVTVARQLPALEVSKAFFKVMGEKVITPSSLVQLVVKTRFVPPGCTQVPQVNELDLEDIDPDEDDLDALMGRKPAKNRATKMVDGKKVENKIENIQPPLAHAPYFARDHSPRWQIFLADAKQGKMAVPPFTFTTFDKPILDESGKPTFNVQTLKMQFQAPPQVGDFTFVMHMVCDSYLGLDTKMEITLHIDDPAKAAALEEEDDISEPDEGKLFLPYLCRGICARLYQLFRQNANLDCSLQIPSLVKCRRSRPARPLSLRRPGSLPSPPARKVTPKATQAILATPTPRRRMRIDRIYLALIDGLYAGLVRHCLID
jgi:translocation protein SEC63